MATRRTMTPTAMAPRTIWIAMMMATVSHPTKKVTVMPTVTVFLITSTRMAALRQEPAVTLTVMELTTSRSVRLVSRVVTLMVTAHLTTRMTTMTTTGVQLLKKGQFAILTVMAYRITAMKMTITTGSTP